ncbi:MAG: glucose-1-phosphate thymidylyltransferase [Candidatus Mariimomonas ferrooxydans]
MKAILLSGGKGTRLRPLTYSGAKQLVPVANKPIIFYCIENIVQAGIKDVGIIISPETGEEIKETVGNGNSWGINIEYLKQDVPGGLAHAIKVAQDFLSDSSFVMYLGDNLIGMRIDKFVKEFKSNTPDALILLKNVDNPGNFGVAEVTKAGKVIRLIEKPDKPKSNLALVGIYIFSSKIHGAIERIKPSKRGELEITDAIQELMKMRYKVESFVLDEWWIDTGKKDDLLTANAIVLDNWLKRDFNGRIDKTSKILGRVVIGKNSVIKKSTIRGPVIIGENTEINNSFIGPYTSIGNSVKIINSSIEHSVVMDESELRDIERIEESLVGRRVKIRRNNIGHKALRLMLCDDSVVEV